MPFHVSSDRVDQNVRRLAMLTGMSFTEAIDCAVVEKIQRLEPKSPDPDYVRNLMGLSARIRSKLQPDQRSAEELIGYDPDGLPV